MINKPNKKIWKKFSKYQKSLWEVLNYKFNAEELYPPKSPTFSCTKKEIECVAHNLALVAVWTVGEDIEIFAKRRSDEISKKTNSN